LFAVALPMALPVLLPLVLPVVLPVALPEANWNLKRPEGYWLVCW
jgi:hypothetical protein